tara:strand:+ start:1548 stop:1706 length:159 start_codon:yes stop_codon:yes gene_type:complete
VPIIGLTASALLEIKEDAETAGMNDFVAKPFNPIELKHKIITHLIKPKCYSV